MDSLFAQRAISQGTDGAAKSIYYLELEEPGILKKQVSPGSATDANILEALAGKGDMEALQDKSRTADTVELKKPTSPDMLRKMIASGKSVPSKASTK
jgi:hypothetical protein